MQPVETFNFAIENSNTHEASSGRFNGRQIVILVLGGGFWILVLIGLFGLPDQGY
jgi:hypothetical protein